MITAEQFLNNQDFYDLHAIPEWSVKRVMIEFAKLHVKAAKKEYHKVLIKQGVVTDAGIGYFDNAYPLENIK